MNVSSGTEHEDLFRRVYADNFEPLLAYALRRVEHPEDAADVVAETFLVAWRRRHEMPPDGRDPAVAVRRGPAGAGQPPPRRDSPAAAG